MIGMTIVCVVCAVIAIPALLAISYGLIHTALTGAIAITIWKGRGWIQAFSVGAIFPHVGGFLMALSSSDPIEFSFLCFVFELVAVVAGIAAAAYHGFLVRRKGIFPVPDLPYIRDWLTNEQIDEP
jgi:hypothetical protein